MKPAKKNRSNAKAGAAPAFGFRLSTVADLMQRALRLHQELRLSEAADLYRQILQREPKNADAMHLLGVLAFQIGQFEASADYIRGAIALYPDAAAYHSNLGNTLKAMGDLDGAVLSLQKALQIDPRFAEAHSNLGNVLKAQNKLDAAITSYRTALRLNDRMAEAWSSLGSALQSRDELDEAIECYHKAIARDPNCADAHANLGSAMQAKKDIPAAIRCYDEALRIRPNHAEAYNNLGAALAEEGDFDAAIAACRESLRIRPNFPDALLNLGTAFQSRGDFEEAIASFDKALSAMPEHAELHLAMGLCKLMRGELGRGWDEYEWRFKTKSQPPHPFAFPVWNGEDLSDKTLLIVAEQGIGDEILFASCIGDAIRRAKRVVLECEPRLAPLYRRAFPEAAVFGVLRKDPSWLSETGPVDFYCPIGSLPRLLRRNIDDFPATPGFLLADPERVAHWKAHLDAALGPGLKVGISWRSKIRSVKRDRNYPFLSEEWGPILSVPGVQFVSLQYDRCEPEIAEAEERFGVKIYCVPGVDLMEEVDESGAITAALDLVLAPANSVSALAGALGVPTRRLIVAEGEWLTLGTDRNPFFPSLRSVRQQKPGDWSGLMQELADEIAGFVRSGTLPERIAPPTPSPNRPSPDMNAPKAAPKFDIDTEVGRFAQLMHQVYNSAWAMMKSGQSREAERLFLEAQQPIFAAALVHHHAGRFEAAEPLYELVRQYSPDQPDVLHLLGLIRHQRHGDLDGAIELIGQAIQKDPGEPSFYNNLGNVLRDKGETERAASTFRQAILLVDAYPEAWNNLGLTLKDQGELTEALAAYDRAIELRHDFPEAHSNRGVALQAQGDRVGAIRAYETALAQRPDYPEAWSNLGSARRDNGEPDAALAAYDQALALRPDLADAHFNRSLVLLLRGDLESGWAEYAWRWRTRTFPARPFPFPEWDGDGDGGDLSERTILLYAEQGLGDEILFASCLADVAARAKQVVVECDPRLAPLLRRSFPTVRVVGAQREDQTWLGSVGGVDCQTAIGSVPRWLRKTIADFPDAGGFLVADPERVAAWKQRLAFLGAERVVGISWRSRLGGAKRGRHYTALSDWAAILATPNTAFVNLQYDDDCEAELAEAERRHGVRIHRLEDLDLTNDLDETAALTAALDAVIAPANSVSALAGALGVPTFRLGVHDGDWSLLGTDRSPWFPSFRLFRQPAPGDWPGALAAVAAALRSGAERAD